MTNLTMSFQLTIPAILRRAETLFADKQVISEQADKTLYRYSYRDLARRAKKLAVALQELDVRPGDRVATLCWNHHRHLEIYFGVMSIGAVLHTLNLRLHANDLTYIANHAQDKVILVDEELLPILDSFRQGVDFRQIIILTSSRESTHTGVLDYERLLASPTESSLNCPELDENQPAALCYTSGTTGNPKGVLYSHRALALHSLALATQDCFAIGEADVVFPLAPMFHANAWGLPFVCPMVGANLILAGPHFDPPHILRILQDERVTFASGVPTIWLGVLQYLDNHPRSFDLSALHRVVVAGSAVPKSLIAEFAQKYGVEIVQAWGMTETAPIGTVCLLPGDMKTAPAAEQIDFRARQGMPLPFIEIRARGGVGLVPWDGRSVGELEVRGPWVSSGYYQCPEAAGSFTEDGWLRTGDIVTIGARGCIQIQDRAKDLIKSGGEWISSVALENALMGHPAVAEAAVFAVAHEKWQERPLAAVVLKPGQSASQEELLTFLTRSFAKWWLPDAFVFLEQIPRTSAGKFLKKLLRERFHDYLLKHSAAKSLNS
jgi:fatty-acyl-CoA synthase